MISYEFVFFKNNRKLIELQLEQTIALLGALNQERSIAGKIICSKLTNNKSLKKGIRRLWETWFL